MKKQGFSWKTLMLIGLLPTAIAGAATAAPSERPRPENFANYSLYVQALVDYQRAQETTPAADSGSASSSESKFCKDDQGAGNEDRQKNSCEGKYLLTDNILPDDNKRSDASEESTSPQEAAAEGKTANGSSFESLEEAIAKAQYSVSPDSGSSDFSTTPREFPLTELPTQDLSSLGVDGLLGLFDNVRMSALSNNNGASSNSSISLDSDGTYRANIDNYRLSFDQTGFAMLAGFTFLADGYSIVSATTTVNGDSLAISLSSETHTSIYIVDRDGIPGSAFDGAGAVAIDQLSVFVPRLNITMQGVRSTSNDGLFELNAISPQPIYIDLSNTHVGVSDAVADGSRIGEATNFLAFGPQSILTIGAGTTVNALIGKPDGLNVAFVTLNGRVGDIALQDISLLDNNSGGKIRIGKLSLSSLELDNARIFLDNQKVVIDTGNSFSNMSIAIERVYLGNEPSGAFIGDFYATSGRINNVRLTAEPH